MIDIVLSRKGGLWVPFSDYDRDAGLVYPENMMCRAQISGSKKPRSYRELCAYKGSCDYIAGLGINPNMNTGFKVDHLTKLKCGFVKDTVFDPNGLLHWIVDSLSYANCDQPPAHKYIAQALEEHAALVGVDVDEYVKNLNERN